MKFNFFICKWLLPLATSLATFIPAVWSLTPSESKATGTSENFKQFCGKKNVAVVGNLGGVPVNIPMPYANFLEYDNDPHFMESRKSPPLRRTYQSKLRSFGFEIHFPDMVVSTEETAKKKKLENIYTTQWLQVGINTGSYYGGNPLERYINYKINLRQTFPPYRYVKSPNIIHDLTVYVPVGIDESQRSTPGGAGYNDRNVYFNRDEDGKADAYIECSNALHDAAPCELKFNLAPKMLANVAVNFRK